MVVYKVGVKIKVINIDNVIVDIIVIVNCWYIILVELLKNVIGINMVDNINVIFIRVFWIWIMDLWVVCNGDKFFLVIICFMFFIIIMVLFISKLIVSIMVNMVSVLIVKLNVVSMSNVFSNMIGIVSVGIKVVWKFCKNKYMIRNINIIVLIRVCIMFLIEVDIIGVVL